MRKCRCKIMSKRSESWKLRQTMSRAASAAFLFCHPHTFVFSLNTRNNRSVRPSSRPRLASPGKQDLRRNLLQLRSSVQVTC